MKSFVTLFFLLSFSILVNAQNCKYEKNKIREIPTYNQVVSLVGINLRMIQGKIVNWQGDIISKSIVSLHKKTKKGLLFVGSLVVGRDGIYCFKNIPNGNYILKAGFNGFNRTEVEFNLNSRNLKAMRKLDIALELGN
ncbi:MAG: hypothetical protein AAB336_00905 [Acidobacteriota bacterium]